MRFWKIFLVVSAAWWGGTAAATTLTPNYLAFIDSCLDEIGDYRSNPSCWTGTLGNAGTATANATLTGIGSTFTVNESAYAGYADLHATASTTLNAAGTPTYASAYAMAGFMDVLTINFAPYTGAQGSLLLDYTIDGTAAASAQESAFAYVNVNIGANLEQGYASPLFNGSVNANVAISRPFSFTYGEPFGIYFYLTAFSGSNGYATNVTGSAASDFGATLLLSGITVRNPSGIVFSGAQDTSGSGIQYGLNGPVPEASTASMLALGLSVVWLAGALNRRRTGNGRSFFKLTAQPVFRHLWLRRKMYTSRP